MLPRLFRPKAKAGHVGRCNGVALATLPAKRGACTAGVAPDGDGTLPESVSVFAGWTAGTAVIVQKAPHEWVDATIVTAPSADDRVRARATSERDGGCAAHEPCASPRKGWPEPGTPGYVCLSVCGRDTGEP